MNKVISVRFEQQREAFNRVTLSVLVHLSLSLVNLHVHAHFHCLNTSSTPETPLLRRKGASSSLHRLIAQRDLFVSSLAIDRCFRII